MHKIITALALSGTLVLSAGADSGCSGGEPLPGDTEGKCLVYGRDTNTNGQEYLDVKCNAPGGELADSAQIVPSPGAWPGCGNGTTWPDCKNN